MGVLTGKSAALMAIIHTKKTRNNTHNKQPISTDAQLAAQSLHKQDDLPTPSDRSSFGSWSNSSVGLCTQSLQVYM